MTTTPMLSRRSLVGQTLLGAFLGSGQAAAAIDQSDEASWAAFRSHFITADGRVIDTGNDNVSHTEGQGWGLLFAASFDDRDTFDRIDSWTSRTLARPNDALHVWRYRPQAVDKTDDPNNATDGDLFIAAALAQAGRRWHRAELTSRARAIARSLLDLVVRPVGNLTLLAPGVEGFSRGDGLVVNPSYYAFPALDEMARLCPHPAWTRLRQDGIALLGRARFGQWQLPSDWALVAADGGVDLAPGLPPRYGYDAVRVPLYLAWAGIDSPLIRSVETWWRNASPPPAWVDLQTGGTAEYAAGSGMAAAMQVAVGHPLDSAPADPTMDYYSAALSLLAHIALRDITARRTGAGLR